MTRIYTDCLLMKLALAFIISVFACSSLGARDYLEVHRLGISKNLIEPELISGLPIEKFSKAELGIYIPEEITLSIDEFLKTGKGINPFDPDQVDVSVFFEHELGACVANAFYYEAYSREPSTIKAVFDYCPDAKWNKNKTPFNWRVRFAPPYAGNWTASVHIKAPSVPGIYFSSLPLKFEVMHGNEAGFLETGSDKRHFRLNGNKKSFFCLGQDIAWPDGSRFRGSVNAAKPYLVAGGYMDIQDWIENLSQSGGNMVRVVNVPWSYEIEWDTLGKYNMARAWELDTLFSTCELNDVKMMFCMEHGTYTVLPGEQHLDWNKHPYHRTLKNVEMPEDFLVDSTARSWYRKKLRYFLARWGYSQSLGVFQLISEMEHWTLRGKNTNLKDNKGAQKKFLNWHNEMLAFAKEQVAYRPLLTSTSYGAAPRDHAINAFSSPFVDVVCPRHCYFTQRNDNLDRWNEVNSKSTFEKGIHTLFPDKPAFFDELGFGTSAADPNDIDACNDITYHNTIWATSFMGTAGSGMYWWRWGSNAYRENNFPALAAFFKNVDFEAVHYTKPGHWEDAARFSNVSIETFYTISDDKNKSRVIGWVHNASYWWGNISNECKDRNGKSTFMHSKTRDDKTLDKPTELPAGTAFEVHDLSAKAIYSITWFSTREAGKSWSGGEVKTNRFGTARILWIAGEADYSYKLVRK